MSEQPPWETHIQPGWGTPQPPPQQQPPQQQPQQGGGWNQQGPYAPPQPPQQQQPQYGPPPSQSGVGQYPGFQQPAPPQFTPPQMPGQQMPGDQPPAKGPDTRRILYIVAGIVAIVGVAAAIYFLTNNKDDKKPAANPSSTSAPTSASSPEQSASSFPDNSYTGSPSNASASSSAAPPSTASQAGGSSLDKDSTDKTPFTQAGMVASTFTDGKKVAYTLKSAGPQPCDKVGDAAVEPIVKSAKCTQFMAASWTDPDGRIIVSAMIIPYPDADTAKTVYSKLSAAHTGDYNQWCPPAGQPGADTCGKLAKAGNVTREGKFGNFHRYLLITTAVYTDLRNDDSQKDWLNAAADGAFQNTLPGQ